MGDLGRVESERLIHITALAAVGGQNAAGGGLLAAKSWGCCGLNIRVAVQLLLQFFELLTELFEILEVLLPFLANLSLSSFQPDLLNLIKLLSQLFVFSLKLHGLATPLSPGLVQLFAPRA
jgi:hypothetical protein